MPRNINRKHRYVVSEKHLKDLSIMANFKKTLQKMKIILAILQDIQTKEVTLDALIWIQAVTTRSTTRLLRSPKFFLSASDWDNVRNMLLIHPAMGWSRWLIISVTIMIIWDYCWK